VFVLQQHLCAFATLRENMGSLNARSFTRTTFMQSDEQWMRRAIELAAKGEGAVEPNPMVGCVLVKGDEVIGEGWHEKFGDHHAEVNAIRSASTDVAGATAYVTLEPCSHQGKTPPCCQALIDAKVSRVVVAVKDPDPRVAGQGIAALRSAGIEVVEDVLAREATAVLAPYLKRTTTGKPWIIAKWAMTIDGKISTANGDSQWISNELSRAIVHQIRGRVDAIMVGSGTAESDDPMLNARSADTATTLRTATRIVFDSLGSISLESKIVQTADKYPTLIAVGPNAEPTKLEQMRARGCEVFLSQRPTRSERLQDLLTELGRRGMTNVLVEGGGGMLGLLNDLGQIDEVQAFIGPKLIGGQGVAPVVGDGGQAMTDASAFDLVSAKAIEGDVHCVWRKKPASV
jgi:diaminohydroxyphosphoribosylaminopyrimidine deaminase/5-amino-6-(5-phosphoribosylamino)uracil reductase